MSFVQKYRPFTFQEVVGQEIAISIMEAIIKDVKNAPKSLIFAGEWGSGKTTTARIFARRLNCKKLECDKCMACKDGGFYNELDSSVVGNVESMREMKRSFFYSSSKYTRVIVFDECHTITSKSQTDLLKVLEENDKIFFIFCTTEPDKIKSTIHSRSIKIDFNLISARLCKQYLLTIAKKEGIEVDEVSTDLMVRRSKGHIRDLLQELEFYRYVGSESYNKIKQNLDSLFIKYLKDVVNGSTEIQETVTKICNTPIHILQDDFTYFRTKLADSVYIHNKNIEYKPLLDFYFKNLQYVNTSSDWYAFLISAKNTIKKEEPQQNIKSRFTR